VTGSADAGPCVGYWGMKLDSLRPPSEWAKCRKYKRKMVGGITKVDYLG